MNSIPTHLKTIAARAEAASEGPWTKYPELFFIEGPDGVLVAEVYESHPDAEFIAAARTDIPKLVKALEFMLTARWTAAELARIESILSTDAAEGGKL